MQMGVISLIDEKQNNGRNYILFDVYLGKLFNFNKLIMIKYSGSNEKKVAHGPHRSPKKTVLIYEHIWLFHKID